MHLSKSSCFTLCVGSVLYRGKIYKVYYILNGQLVRCFLNAGYKWLHENDLTTSKDKSFFKSRALYVTWRYLLVKMLFTAQMNLVLHKQACHCTPSQVITVNTFSTCIYILNTLFYCVTNWNVAPRWSGKQQDVLWWSGMPKAADGGHEVPSSAWETSHVSEPENQTQKVHCGCTLCCRRHGCHQRYGL